MPELDNMNSIICIDPNGDLTLVIGPDKVRMRVDANALRRTSKVFDRMLFGPFMESNRTAEWTVELPEDDPEALEVIFNAAHANMRKVPPHLGPSMVYRITVMADKYLMLALLQPWASTWKSTIKVKRLQNLDKHGTTYEDLQKLCVMYYFGTEEELKEILVTLILKTRTDPEGNLLFKMMANMEGEGSPEWTSEWDTFGPLPQSVIDFARTNRHRMITRLLRSLNNIFDFYTAQQHVDLYAHENRGRLPKPPCRILAGGVMVQCLRGSLLWPIPSSDTGLHMVELANIAKDVRYRIVTQVIQTCRCNTHIAGLSACEVQLPPDIQPKWWEKVENDLLHWNDLVSRMSKEYHRI